MIRAIIADDEEFVRYFLKTMLESVFFEIAAEVASGEDLLPAIKEQKPDILMLDINMPKLKGNDFVKKYKEELKDICVIILTISSSDELKKQLQDLGVKYFIRKDTPSEKLVAQIQKYWNEYKRERA